MTDAVGLLFLLGIFITSICIVKWKLLSRGKNYPPGPWGFPIVGHLTLFGSYPPATFYKWREHYGAIFRIRMGSWNTVVINDYSDIKDALERSDDAFSSRPKFFSMDMLRKVNNNTETVAFGPFNQSYVHLRKLTANALNKVTNTNQASTQDLILEEANILIDKFLSWKGEPHFLGKEIQFCIGSIVHQILFGRDQNVREDIGFQAGIVAGNEFAEFSGSGNPLDVMPWLKYFMPWKASKLCQILKKSADIRYQHALNHKKTFDKRHIRDDVTDIFLAANLPEEADDEEVTVTKSRLLRNLNTLTGAGLETTISVMNWLMTYMVAFPEVQRKVQRELDEVIGCGRNVDLSDKTKLCYTEATIMEVHRVTSAVPFSTPHYTIKDTKLHGFDIDKDTVILTNLHSVHMDKLFWDDPDKFQPERLITDSNELDIEKCNRIIPFGLGKRRCLGERLAKMELFLLFANLMYRCSFSKADAGPVDLTQVRGLVYKTKPMKIVVHAR